MTKPKQSGGSESPNVKIVSIADGMKRLNVSGTILSLGQTRDIQTKRGPAQVAEAILKDESGSITLSLFDEDIAKVSPGAKVQVENGYASAYKGKVQLNVGMYGKLVVLA